MVENYLLWLERQGFLIDLFLGGISLLYRDKIYIYISNEQSCSELLFRRNILRVNIIYLRTNAEEFRSSSYNALLSCCRSQKR